MGSDSSDEVLRNVADTAVLTCGCSFYVETEMRCRVPVIGWHRFT